MNFLEENKIAEEIMRNKTPASPLAVKIHGGEAKLENSAFQKEMTEMNQFATEAMQSKLTENWFGMVGYQSINKPEVAEAKEAKSSFNVGDKVVFAKDALQKHSKSVPPSAGYSKEMMDYRKELSDLQDKDAVGTVTKVFDSGSMNVKFDGKTFDIKPYMVVKSQSVKESKEDTKEVSPKFKAVKVVYDDGTEMTTSVNGKLSDDEIMKHFPVGSSRNIGHGEHDKIVKIKSAKIVPSTVEEVSVKTEASDSKLQQIQDLKNKLHRLKNTWPTGVKSTDDKVTEEIKKVQDQLKQIENAKEESNSNKASLTEDAEISPKTRRQDVNPGDLEVKEPKNRSNRWDVLLNGKRIDSVSYNSDMSAEEVKKSLVNHDGFSNGIKVVLQKNKSAKVESLINTMLDRALALSESRNLESKKVAYFLGERFVPALSTLVEKEDDEEMDEPKAKKEPKEKEEVELSPEEAKEVLKKVLGGLKTIMDKVTDKDIQADIEKYIDTVEDLLEPEEDEEEGEKEEPKEIEEARTKKTKKVKITITAIVNDDFKLYDLEHEIQHENTLGQLGNTNEALPIKIIDLKIDTLN